MTTWSSLCFGACQAQTSLPNKDTARVSTKTDSICLVWLVTGNFLRQIGNCILLYKHLLLQHWSPHPIQVGGTQLIECPHTSLHQPTEPVCCGRRQLAEKEEALAAASDELADIDSHMHSLAAKYDKTLARLAEDRKAVAMEEAERDAEESTVESAREQAAAAEAAVEEQQARFDEQANTLGCCHGKHVTMCMQCISHLCNRRCYELKPFFAVSVCLNEGTQSDDPLSVLHQR